jgi:hypothetical protein
MQPTGEMGWRRALLGSPERSAMPKRRKALRTRGRNQGEQEGDERCEERGVHRDLCSWRRGQV